ARPGAARDDGDEGGLLCVVRDRRFGNEQRVGMLFQHDLGVRRHVGFELLAGVLDRHLRFERRDVVFLDAQGRDLRYTAVEHAIFEGLDAYARQLAEAHAPDVRFVDFASDEYLLDVTERHDQRRIRAQIQ